MTLLPKIFKSVNVTMDSNKVNIGSVDPITFLRKEESDISNHTKKDNNINDKKQDIIQEAEKYAKEIIKKAEDEAEKVKTDLEQQLKNKIKNLEETSQKEGYEKGYNLAVLEVDKIKEEALSILENAKIEKNRMVEELEPQIVDLIINILNKLLYKSVEIDKAIIINLIKQGLDESSLSGDIKIKVSPKDYEMVMKNKDNIISMAEGSSNVEIIKDLSLNKADCIIETSFGNIDCSLDEQFKILKENIFFILGNR